MVPSATCATVAMEHGHSTTASGKLLPLAGGAARSSGRYTVTLTPACARKAAVTASRPAAARLNS